MLKNTSANASFRGEFWSSSKSLDDKDGFGVGAVWLKGQSTFPATPLSLKWEGWVQNQSLIRSGTIEAELREGYVNLDFDKFSYRVGRQITVWGRADAINPTDNVSSRDYSLMVPDENDQRRGNFSAKAAYAFGDFNLIGFWLPEFRENVFPLPALPAPIVLTKRKPKTEWSQWAFKIERTGGAADWSLSYFDGLDRNPDLTVEGISNSAVKLALTHHRIRVIGADAAAPAGRFGLRAEAAYAFTEDNEGTDPQIKNPFLFVVLGGDRSFFQYLNFNLQYVSRIVMKYQDPRQISDPATRALAVQEAQLTQQLDQFQHGLSNRVGYKWLHETLEADLSSLLWLDEGDFLLRPKLIYALTDHWKATLGAELYRGPAEGVFGRLKQNSTGFAALRYDL